ncbi:MAG: hypothetical protein C4527_26905 [Candidatus Omnitrophota bacterium]|jgi:hypothetical protein|nr:MAG: hypothetical protein C4527_26905 [Candidatus Omnitrophota bacterium]
MFLQVNHFVFTSKCFHQIPGNPFPVGAEVGELFFAYIAKPCENFTVDDFLFFVATFFLVLPKEYDYSRSFDYTERELVGNSQ